MERKHMTFYQFVKTVEAALQKEVGAGVGVFVYTARKNNGIAKSGLLFSEEGRNISPTIYMEEYYQRFCQGIPVGEIVKEILFLFEKIRCCAPWKEEVLKDYGSLKNRIVYRLINRKANRELLEEVPNVPYLDLSIIFHVLLEINSYGTAMMPVRKEHLDLWETDAGQIYRQACQNTHKIFPHTFRNMCAVLAEITHTECADTREGLYVLTNQTSSFGAAAVLYPGCLRQIGEQLGEDYYVLPSSVHEVIVVRASAAPERKMLDQMISEINETQVDPEEVLSDHSYYFSCEKKELIL